MAAAAVVAAATVLPVAYVIGNAISLDPAAAWDFLIRPRIGFLLTNTLTLVLLASALSIALGVGAAVLVERTTLRAPHLWHALLCAPLAVPAFVNGWAWVATADWVQSRAGAVLVVSLSYYPLVYLPTTAALRRLGPDLEELAATLGLNRAAVAWRVTRPLLAPAVLGGTVLVALHMLAEYGALRLLNYPTLTTAVLEQYGTAFNGANAALISAVLLALCFTVLAIEYGGRGNVSRARIGSGSEHARTRTPLGGWSVPTHLLLAVVPTLALGVPLAALGRWLAHDSTFDVGALAMAAVTSIGYASVAGIVAALAALPAVWLAVRYPGRWSAVIDRVSFLSSGLPGVVVALALITVAIRWMPAVYQTAPLLIGAYVVLFLPRAMVVVRGTLELIPAGLEEVAATLGESPLRVFCRVTAPLLAPGLASAVALVSLAASTELTATLLLSPIGTTTLATQFWAEASQINYSAAAPYAVALIALSAPSTWLLSRIATGSAR